MAEPAVIAHPRSRPGRESLWRALLLMAGSGNGNNGKIANATWAASGKYGKDFQEGAL